MAWQEGYHCLKPEECRNTNQKLREIEGDIETREAQVAFAQFCAANPSFSSQLLMGFDLYPIQDIMIRAMMQKDSFLGICGRGFGKSTIAAVFIVLYAIFNPGIQIGITSASFRQARAIFEKIEQILNHPKGRFLKQCLKEDPKHKSDAWEMWIGTTRIVALPLGSGDKIRGYRFNLLVIDELLLLSERIINEVLLPFMAVQADPREREKTREAEDRLIAAGKLTESERTRFSNNKLIGLTSASYEFEYLYTMYSAYKKTIFDQNAENVSNGIMQLSCEIAPKGLYDESNIRMAKDTFSSAQFNREYMALFTGDSSGFYSARKLAEITLQEGDSPTVKVRGDDTKNYLLAIDPNYDSAEGSDHFAMCVLELDDERKLGYMVHGYAVAACTLNERMAYIKYLFENFNIQYVIVDKAGGEKFIKDINDLEILDFKLAFFENEILNFTEEEVAEARDGYDPGGTKVKKIVHSQYFAANWIRIANETLQGAIQHQSIWFAAPLDSENLSSGGMNIKELVFDETEKYGNSPADLRLKFCDFVDHQKRIIELTKQECAMIEVTGTATGVQRFELPANIKNQTGPNKARKDSYSVLLLANWAKDCYFAIKSEPKKKRNSFKPRWLAR